MIAEEHYDSAENFDSDDLGDNLSDEDPNEIMPETK
jgi:hypothetical protein